MMEENKKKKPYPTNEERTLKAEQKIARLEKLNANRTTLIRETEQVLAKRKAALEHSRAEHESAISLRDRLIASTDGPSKNVGVLAAKKAEKAKFEELKEKLSSQGKTLDDLLNSL